MAWRAICDRMPGEKTEEQVMKVQSHKTPVISKFLIARPINDAKILYWGPTIVLVQYQAAVYCETLEATYFKCNLGVIKCHGWCEPGSVSL